MSSSMMRFAVASGSAPRGRNPPRSAPADPQCDQQDRAVIDAAAADLPGLGDPDRVLLDFSGCVVGTISTATWLPCALERPQLRIERRGLVRRERSGKIGDR
jgi:hypothetical protein